MVVLLLGFRRIIVVGNKNNIDACLSDSICYADEAIAKQRGCYKR